MSAVRYLPSHPATIAPMKEKIGMFPRVFPALSGADSLRKFRHDLASRSRAPIHTLLITCDDALLDPVLRSMSAEAGVLQLRGDLHHWCEVEAELFEAIELAYAKTGFSSLVWIDHSQCRHAASSRADRQPSMEPQQPHSFERLLHGVACTQQRIAAAKHRVASQVRRLRNWLAESRHVPDDDLDIDGLLFLDECRAFLRYDPDGSCFKPLAFRDRQYG